MTGNIGPRGTGWAYSAETTTTGALVKADHENGDRWAMPVSNLSIAASIVTALTDGRIDPHAFHWWQNNEGDN